MTNPRHSDLCHVVGFCHILWLFPWDSLSCIRLTVLLGITCTGRRRGRRTRKVSSGAGYLSVRRFSSVQQFARLTTISYPASICVSCHHNGRQGPALWAVCQLVLGSWETPRYVSSWTNIVNIVSLAASMLDVDTNPAAIMLNIDDMNIPGSRT